MTLLTLTYSFLTSGQADAEVSTLIESGKWDDSSIWSTKTAPSASGTAIVDNGFIADVTANISGTSSQLEVGVNTQGTLNILGGSLTNLYSFLGYNAGASGVATVTSGTWTSSVGLTVGYSGNGSMTINGGAVISGSTSLAFNAGSSATVTIAGGAWNYDILYAGRHGSASLNINGGIVTGSVTHIGFDTNSVGLATLSSGTWTTSTLYIGTYSTGTLNVTGGNLYSNFTSINSGCATITGGTWSNASNFYIAGSGKLTVDNGTLLSGTTNHDLILTGSGGVLSIVNSGLVSLSGGAGNLVLGDTVSASGTLNLGTGGTAGTLQCSTVRGYGNSVVNFNHTGNYTFTPNLDGSLSVNQLGGITLLTGSNSYTGSTTIFSGTMALGADGSLSKSSKIILKDGGVLDTKALNFSMQSFQPLKFTINGLTGVAGCLDAALLDISNGSVDFDVIGILEGSAYIIANYTTLSGTSFGAIRDLPVGYTLDYDYNSGNQIALVQTVPEPYSWLLLTFGAGFLALKRPLDLRRLWQE